MSSTNSPRHSHYPGPLPPLFKFLPPSPFPTFWRYHCYHFGSIHLCRCHCYLFRHHCCCRNWFFTRLLCLRVCRHSHAHEHHLPNILLALYGNYSYSFPSGWKSKEKWLFCSDPSHNVEPHPSICTRLLSSLLHICMSVHYDISHTSLWYFVAILYFSIQSNKHYVSISLYFIQFSYKEPHLSIIQHEMFIYHYEFLINVSTDYAVRSLKWIPPRIVLVFLFISVCTAIHVYFEVS